MQCSWVQLLYSTLDEHDDFSIVLQRQHFDGIIFVTNTADKFIQMSIDANIPCVLVNEYNRNFSPTCGQY